MSVCPDKSNYPLLSTPEHSHFWLLDACAFLPLLGLHASFTCKQRVPKYVAQVLVMYDPNSIGEIIQHAWETLPKRFSHVELDEFMLMPNHIHCIVVLTQPPPQSLDNTALARVPRRFHAHMLAEQAKKRFPPLGDVIRTLKAVSTYNIHKMGVPAFAWQNRYHEFVIRTEAELARARHYIIMNPVRWAKDPFNDGLDD